MPSIGVKLYSAFFKFLLKHRLQSRLEAPEDNSSGGGAFGVTSRPEEEAAAAANPSFTDGVATKDLHIDPLTSFSVRIFLPDTCLHHTDRRLKSASNKKLNHGNSGGGFVSGSNESMSNDYFCRRIARLCEVIVSAVGYRLAPENKYPAAFEDGLKVLHWLGKQSILAKCSKSFAGRRGTEELRTLDGNLHVADAFGASMVEPCLTAHGDPSRCVLLGVSSGGNIVDYLTRKAVEAGEVVALQVLMYSSFLHRKCTHTFRNKLSQLLLLR